MNYTLLILPGLGNSGVEHWQTYWLAQFDDAIKLNQKDWNTPQLVDWLENLSEAVDKIEGPVVLVAHSLACSLVAHWTKNNHSNKIIAALLVAPADVDSAAHTPEETRNFAPIPLDILPFPSAVVTSSNDPYITEERAAFLAKKWGSVFSNVGIKGHLNSDSQLKNWDEGQAILQDLLLNIRIK